MKKTLLLTSIFLMVTFGVIAQAVTGFSGNGFQTTVHLQWDEFTDFQPVGYKIYRSNTSGNYGAAARTIGVYTDYTDYNLIASTNYFYKISAFDADGNESQLSTEIAVSTNNNDYLKIASLDLLIPIYTGGMSAETPDNIKTGLEFSRRVFFRNSKVQLNLKFSFMEIAGDPPPRASDNKADFTTIQTDLRARGILDNQYDAVHIEAIEIYGWFGGTTILGSTGASMGYNWVSFDPNDLYAEGDAWLFTHEFGHTLDLLADRSGYPEMIFNHYPWALPLPNGELFDAGENFNGMGLVLRKYDHHLNYAAPWDGYIEVVDADGDNLPDNDTRVPENEITFGSQPNSVDSDFDGLNDFEEFIVDNYTGSNPAVADTDGDGVLDGADRYPISNWNYEINNGQPVIDGVLDADEGWQPMASNPNFSKISGATLESYTTWDDEYLYFAFESNRDLKYYLMLDADGIDGVFQTQEKWESGNYDDLDAESFGSNYYDESSLIIRSEADVVYMKNEPVSDSQIRTSSLNGNRFTEVRIPHNLGPGFGYSAVESNAPVINQLSFTENDIIGVQVIARETLGASDYEWNDWRRSNWMGLGEPFRYYDMVLKKENQPQDYCTSTSNFPWQDWIAGVRVGTIDQTSGKSTYSDFTNISTELETGVNTPIDLTTGFSWFTSDEYWTVWIDYNQDGILESPIEIAYRGKKNAPADGTFLSTLTGNIRVPDWAAEGATRMRVSMTQNEYSTSCETLDFGEVEDYTVNIKKVITVEEADLELTASANPSSLQNGKSDLTVTVTNNGPSTARGITMKHTKNVHLYAFGSNVATIGNYDTQTQVWTIPSIAAGVTATLNLEGFFIDMETPQTDFFEITASSVPDPDSTPNNDNGDKTPDEDDEVVINFTPSDPADLQIANVAAPYSANSGDVFFVEFQLVNTGGLNAPSSVSAIYLSTDNQLDGGDVRIGQTTPSGVGPGFTTPQTVVVTIPATQQGGNYYLLSVADADQQVFESNENNNVTTNAIEINGGGTSDYCTSTSNFPWEDWIAGVQIGSLNNTSGKSNYSDFTNQTVNLVAGSTTPIELTTGFSWFTSDEYWTVWIDYNQDGILESPIEIAYRGKLNAPADGTSLATLSGNVIIPSWALSGATRMRVSMTQDDYSTSCQTLDFGEVEDYTVNITPSSLLPNPNEDWIDLYGMFYSNSSVSEVEIQKSINGNDFSGLEELETNTAVDEYIAINTKDENPIEGWNYYRLKISYENGATTFGESRKVYFELPQTFELFPNPAREAVNVSLKGLEGKAVELQLTDQVGKVLKTVSIDEVQSGAVQLDVSTFRNGFYTVWVFPKGRKPIGKKLIINKLY